ncbi:MAG: carbamoyltransferase N-terminal domain-containing protein, partial [Elusimicrobiales bacterium]|nr:carbamoyltransferase N-terminal domain-containing protein [Elusimicrobiales bacterium]
MTETKQSAQGNFWGDFFFRKKPPAPPKKTAAQYILGVSISAEGSSAAVLGDGKVIFSAFEPPPPAGGYPAAFPSAVVSAALEKASEEEGEILGVKDLAAVAFCGKPLREYSRFRGEWMSRAPAGFERFMDTAPAAFNKKRLGKGLLSRELAAVSWGELPSLLIYPEHQLACAASAFYGSPFQDSAILVLDGPCEGSAAAICLGSGEKIKTLRELIYPDSPQILSSSLADYAGFGGDSAWELFTVPGDAGSRALEYYAKITENLADLREDGSLRLNGLYFSAAEGMKPDHGRWRALFDLPPRGTAELSGEHLDFAIAARMAIEEIVFRLGAQAKRLTCSTNLCLCAGVELKLAAEGKLKKAG